jgi:hypothetical protein
MAHENAQKILEVYLQTKLPVHVYVERINLHDGRLNLTLPRAPLFTVPSFVDVQLVNCNCPSRELSVHR